MSAGFARRTIDADLAARAVALTCGGRAVLGITGPPGAGKSTLASAVVALLERVRSQGTADGIVYGPLLERGREASLAGAVPVEPSARPAVVEGNYLLHDDGAWVRVAGLLDECWYVDLDDAVRVERLIARHVAHGRSPQAAREWVLRSDETNSRLVARGRGRATLLVPAMED